MPRELPPVTHIEITAALLQNLIGANAATILEIGAHHGDHTLGLLHTFPRATVHSFATRKRPPRFSRTVPRVTMSESTSTGPPVEIVIDPPCVGAPR